MSTGDPLITILDPSLSPAEVAWRENADSYPVLTLGSTVSELLAFGFDRSEALDDEQAVVAFIDPATVTVTWPEVSDQAKSHSIIYLKLQARPTGGARIGIWHSGADSAPAPAPAPVITALAPNTAPKGADVTVAITGTGFDAGATVQIGVAYGLVPSSRSASALSVLVEAVNIAQAGTLAVKVQNGDGQLSNAIDFIVT